MRNWHGNDALASNLRLSLAGYAGLKHQPDTCRLCHALEATWGWPGPAAAPGSLTLSLGRRQRVAPDLQHVRQVLDPLAVRQPPPPLGRRDQEARRVQQPPHLGSRIGKRVGTPLKRNLAPGTNSYRASGDLVRDVLRQVMYSQVRCPARIKARARSFSGRTSSAYWRSAAVHT